MNHIIEKQIRLEEENYRELCKQVLRRDSWRCQLCGSMTNLEVHHQQFRSHAGEDQKENLIMLCFNCHSSARLTTSAPDSGDIRMRSRSPQRIDLTYVTAEIIKYRHCAIWFSDKMKVSLIYLSDLSDHIDLT